MPHVFFVQIGSFCFCCSSIRLNDDASAKAYKSSSSHITTNSNKQVLFNITMKAAILFLIMITIVAVCQAAPVRHFVAWSFYENVSQSVQTEGLYFNSNSKRKDNHFSSVLVRCLGLKNLCRKSPSGASYIISVDGMFNLLILIKHNY